MTLFHQGVLQDVIPEQSLYGKVNITNANYEYVKESYTRTQNTQIYIKRHL